MFVCFCSAWPFIFSRARAPAPDVPQIAPAHGAGALEVLRVRKKGQADVCRDVGRAELAKYIPKQNLEKQIR